MDRNTEIIRTYKRDSLYGKTKTILMSAIVTIVSLLIITYAAGATYNDVEIGMYCILGGLILNYIILSSRMYTYAHKIYLLEFAIIDIILIVYNLYMQTDTFGWVVFIYSFIAMGYCGIVYTLMINILYIRYGTINEMIKSAGSLGGMVITVIIYSLLG